LIHLRESFYGPESGLGKNEILTLRTSRGHPFIAFDKLAGSRFAEAQPGDVSSFQNMQQHDLESRTDGLPCDAS